MLRSITVTRKLSIFVHFRAASVMMIPEQRYFPYCLGLIIAEIHLESVEQI
jgi:hypothetical protein